MREILQNDEGSVVVIVALAMSVLLGVAALVIDVGVLYYNRVALANAADAAALAGVQELPGDPLRAEAVAVSYASRNGVEESRASAVVEPDGCSIRVTTSRTVPLGFARIFGVTSSEVGASARARVGVAKSARGVAPFGVVQQEFVYGETYTLKYGAGDSGGERHGNFGALALGGRGAKTYLANIKDGYQEWLTVGDAVETELEQTELETEPGNMSGPTTEGVNWRLSQCTHDPPCTFDHLAKHCPRLVLVPVIDGLDVDGRGWVVLVGFAAFFLEGVGGSGKDNYVTGRFVRWATDGDLRNKGDYGVRAYRLEE